MYKVISLFTGAGGLDLGLESAGFETTVAVEMDSWAVQTLRHNRSWPVLDRDIHTITSDELLRVSGLAEGEADLLVGGPPCQPFSKSGYWSNGDAKRLDDPRATTLEAYLRVLKDLKPKAFILENVAGLAYKKKDEGIQLLRKTIDSINAEAGTNYSFNDFLLNSADFGVPQLRERVFIVGHREGLRIETPRPTHSRANEEQNTQLSLLSGQEILEPGRTAWDALWDLECDEDDALKMSGKWAELLPSIPEGQNYLYHTDRGEGKSLFGWRRRFWNFLLKLSKRLPSWTITAQPGPAVGPFHWKNRRLSPRELCRLQTFPDDYHICGSLRDCQRQLGNAVPSALAEFLGLEIRRTFFHDKEAALLKPKLVPEKQQNVPDEEPIFPVADKYLHLIDEYEAHPGTGKGYGALKQKEVDADKV